MRNGILSGSFSLCVTLGIAVSIVWAAPLDVAAQQSFGTFSGDLEVKFDRDGVHIKLIQSLSFKDDKNRTWSVLSGYVSDGASIPQAFWSFIGGPLDGPYRNAAIIHDYFCDRRSYDWQEVHQVFYKGMRASGVGPSKAWTMYKAVYYFGPRWEKKIEIPKECRFGPDFSPEDCVLNSEPKEVVYHNPLNKDTFANLLSELRQEGFASEAIELELCEI